jgi:competence protein ComEA
MKWLLFLVFTLAAGIAAAQNSPSATPTPTSPSADLTALAGKLHPAHGQRLMQMINRGTAPSLETLPGIGKARAAAIIAGRPYSGPLDLLRVRGIGEVILANIIRHAQAGFPASSRK